MKIILISTSLVLLQSLPVLGQQPTIEVLELAFEQLEKTQAALDTEIQSIKNNIQKNDTAIQKIKQNDALGYLGRQRLENLLKESQTYSTQIEKLNESLSQQKAAAQKVGGELIKKYDLEIIKLLRKLDDKSINAVIRKDQYAALEIFRSKKSTIKEKTGMQNLEHFEPNQLTIKPDDSPKKIELKADLLKDQEEKYRKIGKQYKIQIADLKKELNLRDRIEDLVTDLALFDQQEEAIGDINKANTAFAETTPTSTLETDLLDSGREFDLQNILVSQKDFDFNSLKDGDLEDVILKLEAAKVTAESKADSLANRAKLFYKKAESIKKK